MIKKLTKSILVVGCIAVISCTMYHCLCAVADRIEDKQPKPKPTPAVMLRIDSLQGLSPLMKETALRRLSKMPTDSVEMIIKKAGF